MKLPAALGADPDLEGQMIAAKRTRPSAPRTSMTTPATRSVIALGASGARTSRANVGDATGCARAGDRELETRGMTASAGSRRSARLSQ